jgi:hypothetical protein
VHVSTAAAEDAEVAPQHPRPPIIDKIYKASADRALDAIERTQEELALMARILRAERQVEQAVATVVDE